MPNVSYTQARTLLLESMAVRFKDTLLSHRNIGIIEECLNKSGGFRIAAINIVKSISGIPELTEAYQQFQEKPETIKDRPPIDQLLIASIEEIKNGKTHYMLYADTLEKNLTTLFKATQEHDFKSFAERVSARDQGQHRGV